MEDTILQVEREGSNVTELWVLTKGAPEVIRGYLGAAPQNYDAAYKEFAAQGGRSATRTLSESCNLSFFYRIIPEAV